jgi:hypothetical protein
MFPHLSLEATKTYVMFKLAVFSLEIVLWGSTLFYNKFWLDRDCVRTLFDGKFWSSLDRDCLRAHGRAQITSTHYTKGCAGSQQIAAAAYNATTPVSPRPHLASYPPILLGAPNEWAGTHPTLCWHQRRFTWNTVVSWKLPSGPCSDATKS